MDGTAVKKVGTLEEIKKEFPDAEYVDAKGASSCRLSSTPMSISTVPWQEVFPLKDMTPRVSDILDGMWWTIDRHLTNEQTRQSARATYLDSIKNGVTTVFDHHASSGEIKDSPVCH